MGFKVVGVTKAQWSRSMPTVPFIRIYSEKKTVIDIDINVFNGLEGINLKFSLQGNKESYKKPSVSIVVYNYYIKSFLKIIV